MPVYWTAPAKPTQAPPSLGKVNSLFVPCPALTLIVRFVVNVDKSQLIQGGGGVKTVTFNPSKLDYYISYYSKFCIVDTFICSNSI